MTKPPPVSANLWDGTLKEEPLNEHDARESRIQTSTATPLGDEEVWAQRRRLTAAMRQVIEQLVTTAAPADELRIAADRLEQYAERLQNQPKEYTTWGNPEASTAGSLGGFFDLSPLMGQANPLAAPIKLWQDGDVIRGSATFGWAYQGPPGHLHGGFVAAVFDETLGLTQSLTGQPGVTGTLTVRYRRPTPLYTELRLEGWVQRVEGRKIFTAARMYAGDTLTAEAEAVFISMNVASLENSLPPLPSHKR